MRFFTFTVIFFLTFLASTLSAQNIDSLQKAVDQSAKTLEKTSSDFQQLKDSLEVTGLRRSIDHNSKELHVFLQEMKEREQQRKQQVYIRIALGTLFLIVLAIGLARRRKLRKMS